jgi:predicted dehydrogenase
MVGLGGVGQRHLRNIREVLGPDAEISAYRVLRGSRVLTDTLKVESGADLEQKFNLKVYSSLDEALSKKPAMVFICNPSSMHIPVALAAAKAGCDLFLEKPISHNLDGVSELAGMIEKNRLVCMVGYQMRYHPCLRRVKAILDSGEIGAVLSAYSEVGAYMPAWHTYEDYRQSYAARADLGGGVVLSQIHEIDFLGWMFGVPRRVFALGGHLSQLELDVEDVAGSLLECKMGDRVVPVQLHQDYLQRPPCRILKVVGEKGQIVADLEKLSVTLFTPDGATNRESYPDFKRNRLFIDELTHFLDCVVHRNPPEISFADGVSSLATALAIKESLATGQPISIL